MDQSKITLIGAYEAKTTLPALLDHIEQGGEYIITRHGKEIARLTPVLQDGEKRRRQMDLALKKSMEARQRCTLGPVSWKELRDQGRN